MMPKRPEHTRKHTHAAAYAAPGSARSARCFYRKIRVTLQENGNTQRGTKVRVRGVNWGTESWGIEVQKTTRDMREEAHVKQKHKSMSQLFFPLAFLIISYIDHV